jgi:hypothetical protein
LESSFIEIILGNEMLPDVPPPPIYTTSAIGGATTVTVQALPLMESIIGAVDEVTLYFLILL